MAEVQASAAARHNNTPAASPTLSIIVVTFNTRDDTLHCLRSAAANSPRGTELVVVDNGSDGTATAVHEAFPAAVVDDAGANLGFAAGVNRGVAAAHGEYVVLLNPDTTVLPGAFENLLAFAQSHPDNGVYGGRTLRPDGRVDASSCWGAPTLWSLTCFATGLSTAFHGSRLFDPESLGRWQRDTVREVPIVTGCLLLMRRADWNALGGMDESFFLYGEDAEFSIRAARHSFRPVIVPTAEIVHAVGGSTSNSGFKMCMVMAGKATLLRRSWSPVRARIGIALLSLGSALRAGLERGTGRDGGTWTTVWDRRDDWRPGYPVARHALFDLPDGD
jgi:GT2 family glycosyltransferase